MHSKQESLLGGDFSTEFRFLQALTKGRGNSRRSGLFCDDLYRLTLLFLALSNAQTADRESAAALLSRGGCVDLGAVTACNYDYTLEGKAVEAISFRPAGGGPFPGLLLVPGYQNTAADFIRMGTALAREGFACLAVTQPGWGRSQGEPDFVGPRTLRVLRAGFVKLEREPYVDRKRMGIFGYSRGGMAASLLAVDFGDVRAAVFGAGIYDFKKEYDETEIAGIRAKMEQETAMTAVAIRQRSSILRMDKLRCPVLILHGERDDRVPVSQALLLRDRLEALKKDFEIQLFPERGHDIGSRNILTCTTDFFKRRLMAAPAQKLPDAPPPPNSPPPPR